MINVYKHHVVSQTMIDNISDTAIVLTAIFLRPEKTLIMYKQYLDLWTSRRSKYQALVSMHTETMFFRNPWKTVGSSRFIPSPEQVSFL